MVHTDGGRAELLPGVFAFHGFKMIVEQVYGSCADILEGTDEAVAFKNPAKEAVVLARCGCASFFFGSFLAEVEERSGRFCLVQLVEHGEGKGAVGADAVVTKLHDTRVDGVDFVVQDICIFTTYYTAILELALIYFYSRSEELAFFIVTDFELHQGSFFCGGLTFAVEQHADLKLFHNSGIFFGIFF